MYLRKIFEHFYLKYRKRKLFDPNTEGYLKILTSVDTS